MKLFTCGHDLVLEKHLTATSDRHTWEWGSRSSPWTRRAWDAPCEEPKISASVQHFGCALLLLRVLETEEWKMYLYWSNAKVTLVQFLSGVVSSYPWCQAGKTPQLWCHQRPAWQGCSVPVPPKKKHGFWKEKWVHEQSHSGTTTVPLIHILLLFEITSSCRQTVNSLLPKNQVNPCLS